MWDELEMFADLRYAIVEMILDAVFPGVWDCYSCNNTCGLAANFSCGCFKYTNSEHAEYSDFYVMVYNLWFDKESLFVFHTLWLQQHKITMADQETITFCGFYGSLIKSCHIQKNMQHFSAAPVRIDNLHSSVQCINWNYIRINTRCWVIIKLVWLLQLVFVIWSRVQAGDWRRSRLSAPRMMCYCISSSLGKTTPASFLPHCVNKNWRVVETQRVAGDIELSSTVIMSHCHWFCQE